MCAVIRFFAACKDGVVLASVATIRHYQYAVLHTGFNGTVVTWHTTHAGAERAFAFNNMSLPTKEIVTAIETTVQPPPGHRFRVARITSIGVELAGDVRGEVTELERMFRL